MAGGKHPCLSPEGKRHFGITLVDIDGVTTVYLSDKPFVHWKYAALRLAGVCRVVIHDHTPGERARCRGVRRLAKHLVHRLPLFTADAHRTMNQQNAIYENSEIETWRTLEISL